MRTYNRALDCMTLALAFSMKGDTKNAAIMFTQASKQPDAKRGLAVLEASNKAAYAATAKVQAAARKVTAGDDLDIGEQEDLDALLNDDGGDVGEAEEQVEVDSPEGEEDEEDDEEEAEFDGAEFAKVLAKLAKPAVAKAKAPTKPARR